ncbi:MAG: FecR domain-containing protein [Candidatus Margulisiibacteriota bacterium]|jgi:hypothetical protein
MLKKIILGMLLISFPVLSAISAAKPAATIIFFQGKVEVYRAAENKWVKANLDMPLSIGDVIVTKESSKAELEFSIGDVVRLAELSSLEIEQARQTGSLEKKTLLSLIKGEAFARVEKMKGKDQGFSIKTPVAVAAVKGTSYLVRYDENDRLADIQVLDGEVSVQGQSGMPVGVPANKGVFVFGGEAPTTPRELSAEEQNMLNNIRQQLMERERSRTSTANAVVGTANVQPTGNRVPSINVPGATVSQVSRNVFIVTTPTLNTPAVVTEQTYAPWRDLAPTENIIPTSPMPLRPPVGPVFPKAERLLAEILDGKVVLNWGTDTEENLGGFVLYRNNQEIARLTARQTEYKDIVLDISGIAAGRMLKYRVAALNNLRIAEPRGQETEVLVPNVPPAIEAVFICNQSLDNLGSREMNLQSDNLISNMIVIRGRASQSMMQVKKVEVSIDGGRTWRTAEGTTAWTYQFTPATNTTYEVQIRAENTLGIKSEPSLMDQVSVIYQRITNTQLLTSIVQDLVRLFSNEDTISMINYVSDSYYGGKGTLQNDLDQAFSAWSNINLSVSSMVIDLVGETQATAQFRWSKSYTEIGTSKTESGASQLNFVKEDSWKLKSISGDRVFTLPPVVEEPGGARPPQPPVL